MIDHRTGEVVRSSSSGTRVPRSEKLTIALGAVLGAIGLTWLAISVTSANSYNRLHEHSSEKNIDFAAPSEAALQPSQTEINNNRFAAMGFSANLEGTAILYPVEIDNLVAPDGGFRTDLSLGQMARTLQVDSSTISKDRSDHEIDGEAEIFKVVVGTLTEQSKADARRHRKNHKPTDLLPNGGLGQFTRTEVVFTLNQLKKPDDARKAILEAVSRTARGIMPEVGDKVRAVGASRGEIESGGCFGWGNLPPESLPIVPAGSGVGEAANP